jgi:hypothetical protein
MVYSKALTELTNVHDIVLVLENGSLVVVDVQVVGCTEDGHDTRESSSPGLAVHAVSSVLSFVCADDGKQVILLQEGTCSGV